MNINNNEEFLYIDEIIELLKDQISSTNLNDRTAYNEGYRQALRDMIIVAKTFKREY